MYCEAGWGTFTNEELEEKRHKGLHVINDGGYHHWIATMAGEKPENAGTMALAVAGALSESVRKDSECVFGILKRRFRVLKIPSLLSTPAQLDDIMRSSAILHNMLLQYDGLDTIGQYDDDWVLMGDNAVAELGEEVLDDNPEGLPQSMIDADVLARDKRTAFTAIQQLTRNAAGNGNRHTPVTLGTDRFLIGHKPVSDEVVEHEEGYTARQESIAQHVEVLLKKKMLYKLKMAKDCRPNRPILGCQGPWSA